MPLEGGLVVKRLACFLRYNPALTVLHCCRLLHAFYVARAGSLASLAREGAALATYVHNALNCADCLHLLPQHSPAWTGACGTSAGLSCSMSWVCVGVGDTCKASVRVSSCLCAAALSLTR